MTMKTVAAALLTGALGLSAGVTASKQLYNPNPWKLIEGVGEPGAVIEFSDETTIYGYAIADDAGAFSLYVPTQAEPGIVSLGTLCGDTEPPTEPPTNGNDNTNDNTSVPPVDGITVCASGCDYDNIKEAVIAAPANSTVIVEAGVYTSGTTKRSTSAVWINDKDGLTLYGQPGAIITGHPNAEGVGETEQLIYVENSRGVLIEGFEFTNARRTAVTIDSNCRDIIVRNCSASGIKNDTAFIGAAFRVNGPAERILFEDLIIRDSHGGIQLREEPTQTASTAHIPGNLTNWTEERGFIYGAMDVTIRRVVAVDNRVRDEHSDGIAARYATNVTIEDSLVAGNIDDGIDLLACTRPVVRRTIAINHDGADNGDGNGIKIGVRGATGVVAHENISVRNARGGIDVADSIDSVVTFNTLADNSDWFGLWTESSVAGHDFTGNISSGHIKGDIGCNGGITPNNFNLNVIHDANGHNWPCSGGPNLLGIDPQFLNRTAPILVPSEGSASEVISAVRAQVEAAYGLQPGSPATGAGAIN